MFGIVRTGVLRADERARTGVTRLARVRRGGLGGLLALSFASIILFM